MLSLAGWAESSLICVFQVCITFPLYDMFAGTENWWTRLIPIFACLSTLFTGILSFFRSLKSWIRVVIALMFLLIMAVGILGVIKKVKLSIYICDILFSVERCTTRTSAIHLELCIDSHCLQVTIYWPTYKVLVN